MAGRDAERDAAVEAANAAAARDRWMGVEIRHLEALAAIAREGSFRGAADVLGYVQSAVSQQLAQLERLVGARLIDRSRGNGPIALTKAGRVLLEHTEEIIARYARANAELASLADGTVGSLRVGMPQSVATRLLPAILGQFAARWPDVEVTPTESVSDDRLFEALADRRLDLLLCELPLLPGPFEAEALMEDPVLLVVDERSALASRLHPVAVADLAGQPFITYTNWRAQANVSRWLADRGIVPEVAHSAGDNATVQGMVAAGMGVALAPCLAIDANAPGVVVRRLAEGPSARILGAVRHADAELSPAAAAFLQVAREVCRDHAAAVRNELAIG